MNNPMVLPDHLLRLMTPEDRASLGKAGRTAVEAAEAFADGQEEELQRQIRQYLNLHGLEFINPSMRRRSALPPGWPDFTFAYRGTPCAVEAKAGGGKLEPDQRAMRAKLEANGWRWLEARSVADLQTLFRAIDAEIEPKPTPKEVTQHDGDQKKADAEGQKGRRQGLLTDDNPTGAAHPKITRTNAQHP